MKNSQLFEQIKQLVKQRHELPPQNPSFAQKYCMQQMSKKKLLPYDRKHKMNHLMKNFQRLQTFVDVEELLKCIFSRLKKAKKGQKQQTNEQKQIPPIQNCFEQYLQKLRDKIKRKLGVHLQEKFENENQKVETFFNMLCDNAQFDWKYKNNTSNIDLKFTEEQNKSQFNFNRIKVMEHKDQNNDMLFTKSQEKFNLQQRKKYANLLHQVSTYLQIILETQYRKKWERNKPKTYTNPASTTRKRENISSVIPDLQLVKNESKQFSPNSTQRMNVTLKKNTWANTTTARNTRRNFSSLDRFKNKLKVNDIFTFRNRNIKSNLMNKVKKFINTVQEEQKLFKVDNKSHLNNLHRLETNLKSQYTKFKQDPIFDEQGIKDVRIRALQFK